MKEMFKKEVGHQLMLLRKEKGINMEKLAEITGVATSTISRYENSTNSMDLDMVEKLVNGCGMEIDIFFTRVIAKLQ